MDRNDAFEPPQHVKVPEVPADVTAPHVIARRRLAGRHYTKEILLSMGIIGAATFFAWIFLRAQAESSPRRPLPPPETAVVAPAVPAPPRAAPRSETPSPARSVEQPKAAKPAPSPKPAPVEAPVPPELSGPLFNRAFRP